MTAAERNKIGSAPVTDLDGEIAYLRAMLARVATLLEKNGFQYRRPGEIKDDEIKIPDKEARNLLFLFDGLMGRLTTMVRAHALLTGDISEYEQLIQEGKLLARQRLGLDNYLDSHLPPLEGEELE